jgi:hypothetical protein
MTQADEDARKAKKRKPSGRSDRLAVALRENLRRRKAQARQRGAAGGKKPVSGPDKEG